MWEWVCNVWAFTQYYGLSAYRSRVQHNIVYITAAIELELYQRFKITDDT